MKRTLLKKLISVSLACITAFGITGCSTLDKFKAEFFEDGEDIVKIGIYEPLSGVDKKEAAKEIEGIELAYGMHPTVDGKKVELVYVDNRSDVESAETEIDDLLKKDVKVILGSYGNANSLAAAGYIDKAQIPAITMTNTNPIITSSSDYYLRVCYVDTYQGVALAEYAYYGINAEKAAILVPEGNEQAAAISQRFIEKFIKLTGKDSSIAANIEYEEGSADYSKQLKKIKKADVSAVFLPSNTKDAAVILKQAQEMGINVAFLGIDEWDEDVILEEAGSKAAGLAVYTKVSDIQTDIEDSSNIDEFTDAYQNINGKDSTPDNAVALGYDAYMIALNAIAKAGSDADGKTIRDTILNMKEYQGASGNIKFNSKGDAIKSVMIYTINAEKGESEVAYIIEADGTAKKVN